ncbi:MAG: hypothetical protein ACYC2S_09805 [Spirochaetales bacterium]
MGIVGGAAGTAFDQNDSPTASLSLDRCGLPADAAGVVSSYAGAVSTFSVLVSGLDDSANWSVTVAVSGLSGSLTGKTYTVTSMSADSGYVDFTAKKSGYTDLVKRFHVGKVKQGTPGSPGTPGVDAPRCRGLYPYLSSPLSPIAEDLVVWFSTIQSERGIYAFSGSDWLKLSTPTPDQITRCFVYILDAVRQGYGVSTDYAVGATAFEVILANYIFAINVILAANGSMKTANYAEDAGTGDPLAGWSFSAASEVIKAVNSIFVNAKIKNAIITDASFAGVMNSAQLSTKMSVSASFAPTGSWLGYTLQNTFNLIAGSGYIPASGTFVGYPIVGVINSGEFSPTNGLRYVVTTSNGSYDIYSKVTYSYSCSFSITQTPEIKFLCPAYTEHLIPTTGGSANIGSSVKRYALGYFDVCWGAVGNDFADALDLPTEDIKPGLVASLKNGKIVRARKRGDSSALGIVSDTYSFRAGPVDGKAPIAVAGYVLAYTDKEYRTGTKLAVDAQGRLTRARFFDRAIAVYIANPPTDPWNKVEVHGRKIVKVRA